VTQRDPFDVEALRVDPEQVARKPGKRKKWQRHFVNVPWEWVRRPQGTKHAGSVYPLAHLLLYEDWHAGGRPIVLSNALAAEVGLSRPSKWRALNELEELGLVQVKRQARKAPRVTVHHTSPE